MRASLAALVCGAVLAGCGGSKLDFEGAKPYAVAWMIDNCKEFSCDNQAGPYGALIGEYEREDGWVFVIQTKPQAVGQDPGQLHLLVPHKKPRERVLLEA